ncbi:hypothetical protein Cgig2_027258 [Carnegiea gigantea]|uniref:MULE transposase domain-containing protein n=1 Tax=Carnegiea gigantea TaxID=171969 RepID=A0A9Q1GXC4_9CARY|nr:hypothetical protein Cgig2_027258 [Carnegiea gigantea]
MRDCGRRTRRGKGEAGPGLGVFSDGGYVTTKLRGGVDLRIVFEGNDEHGHIYVGGNDGLKRRAQKAVQLANDEYTLVIMVWFTRQVEEMVQRRNRMFVVHAVNVNGFKLGYRKILFVYDTLLSKPYKGTLLAACMLDADDHLFNFAYDIVCGEKIEEWVWFLEMVAECLGGSCKRKKSQAPAVINAGHKISEVLKTQRGWTYEAHLLNDCRWPSMFTQWKRHVDPNKPCFQTGKPITSSETGTLIVIHCLNVPEEATK